MVAQQEEEQDE